MKKKASMEATFRPRCLIRFYEIIVPVLNFCSSVGDADVMGWMGTLLKGKLLAHGSGRLFSGHNFEQNRPMKRWNSDVDDLSSQMYSFLSSMSVYLYINKVL